MDKDIELFREVALQLSREAKVPYDKTVIVMLKHGYLDLSDMTLAEIGYIFGVSRELIRQVESRAFKKIKHPSVGRVFKNDIMGILDHFITRPTIDKLSSSSGEY